MTPEPDESGALANVLGALALVVTDEMGRAVASAAHDRSTTDATTLAALAEFLDGSTLDRLHRVLGLTPSGAVRSSTGWRRPTWPSVTRGRTAARARSDSPRPVTSGLGTCAPRGRRTSRPSPPASPDDDVAELRRLLGLVMANVVAGKDGGAWTCRLCDLVACRRPQGECPAWNAAREKFGVARTQD